MRTTMATKTIAHWINNKAYPGTSGNTSPVTNPATGEVTGEVALGSVEDARAVIDAAAAAFPAWPDDETMRLVPITSGVSQSTLPPAESVTTEGGLVFWFHAATDLLAVNRMAPQFARSVERRRSRRRRVEPLRWCPTGSSWRLLPGLPIDRRVRGCRHRRPTTATRPLRRRHRRP
jgi:hypothetical protein